ncbi:hypothetical protein ACFLVI_03635 [Chloroflexota bacterium]
MSLLGEIKKDVLDSGVNINDLLRKCKVLASWLGNEEFEAWIDHELNGYNSIGELPQYRKLHVSSYAHVRNMAWDAARVQIPTSNIPEECLEFASNAYLLDSISYFQHFLNQPSDIDTLVQEWPPEWALKMNRKVYQGMNCLNAWKEIPKAAIESLVDNVRTKILEFVLKIERLDPNAGDNPKEEPKISQKQIGDILNITIKGDVKNLAAGNQAVAQNIEHTIIENDLESLAKFLESRDIAQEDIESLREAIGTDNISKQEAEKGFGDKVNGWLGKMISKAASGTGAIAATMLTEAIKGYYGTG